MKPPVAPVAPVVADGPKLSIDADRVPIGQLVQSLLTDYAKVSVVIDPRVSGDITVRTANQLTAGELPEFLKRSLEPLGFDLVETAPRSYLLRPLRISSDVPVAEAFQPGAQSRSGLVIYGLKHVSAAEMARLAQPLAPAGVSIIPDKNREILIIAGPPDAASGLARSIELLDVDWLAGMSYALVPVSKSDPVALIGELKAVFGGADGPIGTMVEFVPFPSRRAILVLAKRPERLEQAQSWISQLDNAPRAPGRLRYLPLSNANAQTVAETLGRVFDGGGTSATASSPQTTPSSRDVTAGSNSPTVRISADSQRNGLIIQADPATYEDIAALAREIDAPIDQVVIEATIAEVTLNNDLRFGIQWSADTRDGGRVVLTEGNTNALVARFPGLSYGYSGTYVRAALNALAARTNVEVISSPVIATLDNQQATLQVGDEIPIVTQVATNITTPDATVLNSVQYRQTGIVLKVTPRIGAGGLVTVTVKQEASDIAETRTSGIDSPTIQQRKFESTITVADGETVALGGLIRTSKTKTRSGVPIASAIPVVGAAFRNSTTATRKTELIIFLTPRIIRSQQESRQVTQDLRDRLERLSSSRVLRERLPQK